MEENKEIKFPFKCPVCGKDEFENYEYLFEEEKYDDYDCFVREKDGTIRKLDPI